jgi:chorismate mutase
MPGPPVVRALRGATTVEADQVSQVNERIQELLLAIMERNQLVEDDIISIIFTATPDIISTFPATGARDIGFGAVPLLCVGELHVTDATPHCLRVLLHVNTPLGRDELRHIYLHGAQGLRDDLPG